MSARTSSTHIAPQNAATYLRAVLQLSRLRLTMEGAKGVGKLRGGGMDMGLVMGEGRVTEAKVKAEGKFMEAKVKEEGKFMGAMGQDTVVEEAIDEARKVHELRKGQAPGHKKSHVRASIFEVESAGALIA